MNDHHPKRPSTPPQGPTSCGKNPEASLPLVRTFVRPSRLAGGSAPSTPNRRKTKEARIEIRLTLAEKQRWMAKAKQTGRSLSTLLREAIQRTRPWAPKDRKLLQAQLRTLARIGNNLNQLAKWANTYKRNVEAVQIICALLSLERGIHQISKEQPHDD